MSQFGIKRQIEILREYTDRISTFLREHNEQLSLVQAKDLSRNTRILEILFLFNTIAGIAGFAPSFFTNDLSETIIWDTPRIIVVGIISVSLVFYASVILFRCV